MVGEHLHDWIAGTLRTDIESYFRAHYGRLVRALTLVCGSEEAAADAVQEAFVKAHQKWRTVGEYDDPVGWIRRVAINRLRDDHRRTTRKERAVARLGAGETWTVDAPEPSQTEYLATALADLPRQQRLAIACYYLEGLSVAETAAALEVSEGAVKFHLHQGRERLRGLLGEEGRP
jgi:RNA polymerase sigma-70 factor (ECF subfamily)